MATKKKTVTKRPPKQVWLMFDDAREVIGSFATRRAANACLAIYTKAGATWIVAGPYVLAERVRQR